MSWDVVVIGSGFGGAMAAYPLVKRGLRVLMIERGGWVSRGPENWGDRAAGYISSHFSTESAYRVEDAWPRTKLGSINCVGGQSVFYGGASYRFRETDFESDPHIVGESLAQWPIRYADLEPSYDMAERMLGVCGESGADPTEPFRQHAFRHAPSELAPSATRIASAARRLGLHASRIPLAINFVPASEMASCIRCGTCDGFACAAQAKNDIATRLIPALIASGMTLRINTVCTKLLRRGARITSVECVDRVTGVTERVDARHVIVAAGALATPHLLLASELDRVGPAGMIIGRYLTRHCNSVTFGLFARQTNPAREYDKQVAINDFYHGCSDDDAPRGPLGSLQQMTLAPGLVRASIPRLLGAPAALFLARAQALLVMAEDQPQSANGVRLDDHASDRYGMPRLRITHRYSARDRSANRVLASRARAILYEAGALGTCTADVNTFSHALGTVRMGVDERSAPLDVDGRFRGVNNLFVSDGSALPRSAGLNPSLTIAANALRIGTHLAAAQVSTTPFRNRHLILHPALSTT
ncbi:GMC family oxidoreductase [Gemmatimonas sp.]|uniref:GMC family oxidoreductase n=1 Tax=Gemmatimonas sp. TaxID=1962908 RepID=UPI00286E58F4|nr:GMC family oxidoreductase [Gemmatimonas sp.]